jgi:endoglucanase
MFKNTFYLVLSLVFVLSCTSQKKQTQTNYFDFQKGVNLSHWLSQTNRVGLERDTFITKNDIALIASIGYDHVRLPIDEVHLWDEQGKRMNDGFELLHQAIGWLLEHQLKVVVDLHIVRSHHFNSETNSLWTDTVEQEKFVGLWRELSAELNQYSITDVAYEIMNEAVAENPEDWNKLIAKTIQAIRQLEPERKIIVGSNMWQSVTTFKDLVVPENDKNIILSFHFYEPFLLTHYQAIWTKIKDYNGPINYPGISINPDDLNGVDEKTLSELLPHNLYFDKQVLDSLMKLAVVYANEKGLQLYCGEWGCLPSVPRATRLQWYKDVCELLNENNIAWSNWDYKGGFGIINKTTIEPNQELINILLDK